MNPDLYRVMRMLFSVGVAAAAVLVVLLLIGVVATVAPDLFGV